MLNKYQKLYQVNGLLQMMLGSVGKNKAYAIRSEIALALYSDNTKLRNRGLVPMVEVLKYFSIDLNYLKDILAFRKQIHP